MIGSGGPREKCPLRTIHCLSATVPLTTGRLSRKGTMQQLSAAPPNFEANAMKAKRVSDVMIALAILGLLVAVSVVFF